VASVYKVTDENSRTFGGCQWGPGHEHMARGGGKLCSARWLHAYPTELVAAFLHYCHRDYGPRPILWEADADIGKRDGELKLGCTRLKTIRPIAWPDISAAARVRAAILCARRVCRVPRWLAWADAWLDGTDRTTASAVDVGPCVKPIYLQARRMCWEVWSARAAARAVHGKGWVGPDLVDYDAAALSAGAAGCAACYSQCAEAGLPLEEILREAIEAEGEGVTG